MLSRWVAHAHFGSNDLDAPPVSVPVLVTLLYGSHAFVAMGAVSRLLAALEALMARKISAPMRKCLMLRSVEMTAGRAAALIFGATGDACLSRRSRVGGRWSAVGRWGHGALAASVRGPFLVFWCAAIHGLNALVSWRMYDSLSMPFLKLSMPLVQVTS